VRLPDQQAIKKALERQRVTELRALYPPFPHGALEDDEPPDFILRTDAGVIGIEVTGLYTAGGEVARATEGAWAGLLDGARKRYAAAGLPPVQVIAYWNARAPTTRRVTAALRNALATTVGRMVSASSGGFDTHIEYSGQRGVQLPEGIERLRVRRVHDAADGFWSFGQGGVVPGVVARLPTRRDRQEGPPARLLPPEVRPRVANSTCGPLLRVVVGRALGRVAPARVRDAF
jgi:hypothetical protein